MTACCRLITLMLLAGSFAFVAGDDRDRKADEAWKQYLAKVLPQLGHRNWIVIADSAFPSQSHPGIVNVSTNSDHPEVVEAVLELLDKHKHLRPIVHLDAELPHVEERDARGIARYRNQLKRLIGRRPTQSLPHDEIIRKLEVTASRFNVVVLKTNLTLPYTSVFLELDCGYWTDEAEKRLREAMKKPPMKE